MVPFAPRDPVRASADGGGPLPQAIGGQGFADTYGRCGSVRLARMKAEQYVRLGVGFQPVVLVSSLAGLEANAVRLARQFALKSTGASEQQLCFVVA